MKEDYFKKKGVGKVPLTTTARPKIEYLKDYKSASKEVGYIMDLLAEKDAEWITKINDKIAEVVKFANKAEKDGDKVFADMCWHTMKYLQDIIRGNKNVYSR